jgi:VanZ like family
LVTNTTLSPSWRKWWGVLFPLLGYGAIIFYLSHQSHWLFDPPDFFSSDKVYHLLEYALLGVLSARVVEEYQLIQRPREKMAAVLLFCFLYGLSDEIHQWFIPGRFATAGDVLADTLGGLLGGLIYFKWKGRRFLLKVHEA